MISFMFSIFSKSRKSSSIIKKKVANNQKPSKVPQVIQNVSGIERQQDDLTAPLSILSGAIALDQNKLEKTDKNLKPEVLKNQLSANARQTLIEQALAIHKVQSKLLDDLDPEMKRRLRLLAMEKIFKIPKKS
jgi:hypothetical protein